MAQAYRMRPTILGHLPYRARRLRHRPRLGRRAERLRHTNTEAAAALARPGRYHAVAANLRVKEVPVAPGGDGDDGVRTSRFVV
jgi:hypothetical protein